MTSDFLFRFTCRKLWMELEAHYFAGETRPSWDCLIDDVVASSNPISTITYGSQHLGIPKAIVMNQIRKLEAFCDQLEADCDWLASVCESNDESLFDTIDMIENGMI